MKPGDSSRLGQRAARRIASGYIVILWIVGSLPLIQVILFRRPLTLARPHAKGMLFGYSVGSVYGAAY
jgi:hypothetical protein